MKKGFTLAEVLITLGIIGIVAAMTIPTLMNNIQGAKYRNKFKKAVSVLSQAGKMSLAKNNFSYGDVNIGCSGGYSSDVFEGTPDNPEQIYSICAIFESTLKDPMYRGYVNQGYIKSTVTLDVSYVWDAQYILQDGTIIGFPLSFGGRSNNRQPYMYCKLGDGEILNSEWILAHKYTQMAGSMLSCLGFIDVNGPNGPNKEVTCSNDAETNTDIEHPCVVENKDITDIYPIVFHDTTVEPASNAAKYVFNHAK